jgi:tetratricopeptide (TPR) repeat protein
VYFADVVGYSRLSANDEDQALRIVHLFQEIVRTTVDAHHGRIVKFLGDGALVEFGSTDAAAHAAYSLLKGYVESSLAAGHPSSLRIGLHLGEVVQEPDGDVYGEGVNLASRLQAYASPGELLVSEPVWRQLRQRPGFRFERRGRHRFEGGIASESIFVLASLDESSARKSVRFWTRVRRSAERVRELSTVRLLILVMMFALLPVLLGPRLQGYLGRRTESASTEVAPSLPYSRDPRAAALFRQGRRLWLLRTPESLEAALGYFGEAIAADPSYAVAYAGVADVYSAMSSFDYGLMAPRDAYPRARAAVATALALDSTLALAHATLGSLYMNYDRDWVRAEEAYLKALEVDPGYPDGYHWYAQFLSAMGRHPEALEQLLHASELDPGYTPIQGGIGRHYYFLRDYQRAIQEFESALREDSTYLLAAVGLGLARVMSGDLDGGIAQYRETAGRFQQPVPIVLGLLGHAYGLADRREEALQVLATLAGLRAAGRYVPAELPAMVYLGLGQHDSTMVWLEKALESHSNGIVYLAVEPLADPLRQDPTFRAFIQRLGLGDE